MIDDPRKTDLLIAMLKEFSPIQTNITRYLASALAKQSPDISIPDRCNVIDVVYSGDMGGILCCLDIGGSDTKNPHLVSITHLTFNRNVPLARDRGLPAAPQQEAEAAARSRLLTIRLKYENRRKAESNSGIRREIRANRSVGLACSLATMQFPSPRSQMALLSAMWSLGQNSLWRLRCRCSRRK